MLPQSVYAILMSAPFGLQPGYAACLYVAVGFIIYVCISMTCKVSSSVSFDGLTVLPALVVQFYLIG